MAEDVRPGATLIIRAWRAANGEIEARITHAVDGAEPALEITAAESESEILATIRGWLDRIDH